MDCVFAAIGNGNDAGFNEAEVKRNPPGYIPASCEAGRTSQESGRLPRVSRRSSIHEARLVWIEVENHSVLRIAPSCTSTDIVAFSWGGNAAATEERPPSS